MVTGLRVSFPYVPFQTASDFDAFRQYSRHGLTLPAVPP